MVQGDAAEKRFFCALKIHERQTITTDSIIRFSFALILEQMRQTSLVEKKKTAEVSLGANQRMKKKVNIITIPSRRCYALLNSSEHSSRCFTITLH